MEEHIELLFRGRETGDELTDDRYADSTVDEAISEIRPFINNRRPECEERLVFVKGDEDGQTEACISTRNGLYVHLRRWLLYVYGLCMDCYGVDDADGGKSFTAKLTTVYNNNGGQLWFAVDITSLETGADYTFTFAVVELTEESL